MDDRAPTSVLESTRANDHIGDLLQPSSTAVALVSNNETIDWCQLNHLVDDALERLGPTPRLVQLIVGNNVYSIVWYLAALKGRHPVLLSGSGAATPSGVSATFQPDVVIDASDPHRSKVDETTTGTRHNLHPDLAVLLSTSGSLGSPKLVRLSRHNIISNAQAISAYLNIGPSDRAITTLPMEYCYGLSVINSHLVSGASIVLNEHSVVDECFWDTFKTQRVTSLAGVPHTFDLLERVGFNQMELPDLRFVTQAGGRLPAEQVSTYANLGTESGWDFFVMFGQTEATARMAYLPPEKAAANPSAIGQAIPGTTLTLDTSVTDDPDTGELVFSGDNVMMGYATSATDLAKGAEVNELRTGDIGRINSNGFFEIVGRTSRFVKPFGLRIDLDRIEAMLAERTITTRVTGTDQLVHIAYLGQPRSDIQKLVSESTGLPSSYITTAQHDAFPLLPNGKIDYASLLEGASQQAPPETPSTTDIDVEAIFANVLNRESVDSTESFVSLGGDSLTYIEASVALEAKLGTLPADWATIPIEQLKPATRRSKFWARIDTTALLRMVAILTIVSTHIGLVSLAAGAHVLLGVAGFNFARFQLESNRLWPIVVRVAAPSAVWVGGLLVFSEGYELSNLFFVHNWTTNTDWSSAWRYWFLDVFIQILVLTAVVFAVPAIRKFERNHQFWFAAALLVPAIALRYEIFDALDMGRTGARTPLVLWAFLVGWAAAQATNISHRLLVSVAAIVSVYDFYSNDQRVILIGAGLLMVIWIRQLPVPRVALPVITSIGQASLFIYLTHWQVFPIVTRNTNRTVALLASILAGLVAFRLWDASTKLVTRFDYRRHFKSATTAKKSLTTHAQRS